MRRFTMALIGSMLCCCANASMAVDFMPADFMPAVPMPGLDPNPNPANEDFNWVSSHADFMYVTLGHYPNRRIASRSWDGVAEAWSAPVDIGIGSRGFRGVA